MNLFPEFSNFIEMRNCISINSYQDETDLNSTNFRVACSKNLSSYRSLDTKKTELFEAWAFIHWHYRTSRKLEVRHCLKFTDFNH